MSTKSNFYIVTIYYNNGTQESLSLHRDLIKKFLLIEESKPTVSRVKFRTPQAYAMLG